MNRVRDMPLLPTMQMDLLTTQNNDNPNFILNCEKILHNRIKVWKPMNLFITRIDNWFDQKWLGFSGSIMGGLSVWKEEITVPPFHPNRVITSKYYEKTHDHYLEKNHDKALHIFQESRKNLDRVLSDFTDDGLFIWFSGNTKLNGVGTMMCYFYRQTECLPIFISFTEKKQWGISQSTGISLSELMNIINDKSKVGDDV